MSRAPSPLSFQQIPNLDNGTLSPFPSNDTSSTLPDVPSEHDTGKGNARRPRLEILLDSDCLFLKGTGVDVEPVRLSGNVSLYLAEPTALKEVTLQFKGKAHLQTPVHDSLALSNSPSTSVICQHEWSFLEGEKKHSHTLKAGRHFFPFQLVLDGSLPSSIATDRFGGASVVYKLRAHAARSGLHNNLDAVVPVFIVRSLSAEALEYQQSLEIESTWPEKAMYSIVLPHKAWAVGDKLSALVKFSPLTKGTRFLNISTTIVETARVFVRSYSHDDSYIVASVKHEFVGRGAVEVPKDDHASRDSLPNSNCVSTSSSPRNSTAVLPEGYPSVQPSTSHFILPSIPEADSPGRSTTPNVSGPPEDMEESNDDIDTCLTLDIPLTVTPTHTLKPIVIAHRIRWTIFIRNRDGHLSELRCSLPLHILDHRLLRESRAYTLATRRLLIGGPETPAETLDDMELPSYNAHVRDRVGNIFLPESATVRVSNPWVWSGVSPTLPSGTPLPPPASPSQSSPPDAHIFSYFPDAPGPGSGLPFNSGPPVPLSRQATPPLSLQTTPPDSDPQSSSASHEHSRRSSFEHHSPGGASAHPVTGPNEMHVHNSHTSRSLHGLMHVSKLFSFPHASWLSSRSNTHTNSVSHTPPVHQDLQQQQQAHHQLPTSPLPPQDGDWSSALHRAFTEVPDYTVASRGFIGGVPPLTSMQDLPSYAEAEGERNNSE